MNLSRGTRAEQCSGTPYAVADRVDIMKASSASGSGAAQHGRLGVFEVRDLQDALPRLLLTKSRLRFTVADSYGLSLLQRFGPGDSYRGIDIAHLYSMLLLSDTRNLYELRVILDPTAEDPLRKREDQTWPEWLKTIIQDPFFLGRPHCGARQMREPA